MNRIIYLFVFLIIGLSSSSAQDWKVVEVNDGDTLVSTAIYVDENDKPIADSTGTHKVISRYKNYYLLKSERFGLSGEPTEDNRGVHRQVIFLKKFFKFYDKEGNPLLQVKEPYAYEQSNATYCIFKYNRHSDLLEVRYYKDNVIEKDVRGVYVRIPTDAVESYKGMIHKYQFKYSKSRKTIREYSYNVRGDFVEMRILKRRRIKKSK